MPAAWALPWVWAVAINGVGVSLGVAVAINDIDNTVRARIVGATLEAGKSVALKASEAATIDALSIGGAVAVGVGGGNGVGVAGAGAKNTLHNTVEALILNAEVKLRGLPTVESRCRPAITRRLPPMPVVSAWL